jgi:hypothetical protein
MTQKNAAASVYNEKMKLRSLTLLVSLFGISSLTLSADAAPDSQFDGSLRSADQPGAVAAGPDSPVRRLNDMTGPRNAAVETRSGPPDPFAESRSSGRPDMSGFAGAAVGAGAMAAVGKWVLPALFGVSLGPVGILGMALAGGAAGSFMMGDKPLAVGLAAAAIGAVAASWLFPPLGVVVTAVVLGGGGYILGKKLFS